MELDAFAVFGQHRHRRFGHAGAAKTDLWVLGMTDRAFLLLVRLVEVGLECPGDERSMVRFNEPRTLKYAKLDPLE